MTAHLPARRSSVVVVEFLHDVGDLVVFMGLILPFFANRTVYSTSVPDLVFRSTDQTLIKLFLILSTQPVLQLAFSSLLLRLLF